LLSSPKQIKDYLFCAFALGVTLEEKLSILWKETKNLRVRLNLDSYQPDHVYSLKTIYGQLYFRDNFGDITNLVNLLYRQEYQFKEIPGEGVILDIGANIGLAAAWFSYYNPFKTIYCFEPLPQNVSLLQLNCPTAKVKEVGLGAKRDKVKLHVDSDAVMASSIPCQWNTQEMEFEVISLDAFANSEGLDQVALMKIDVEGMENEVLQGAKETLRNTHRVVMETHSGFLHSQAIGHIRSAGFYIDSEQFKEKTGLLFASRSNSP
jgi:FkbM family methyltransferase